MTDSPRILAFDLSALRVFLAVGEGGSMTAAARHLGLTQPAISQTVARLEQRFGAILVDRAARPMVLTPAGERLAERARRLLDDAESLQASVREVADATLPTLRIGLIDSFAGTAGPSLIKGLRNDARHVSVWSGISPNLADDLLRRRLDIIVTTDPLENRGGLDRRSLMREPFVMVVPRRMAGAGAPARLADVARHLPLVRYSERSVIGAQIESYLDGLGIDIARTLEFDGTDSVFAMVDAGLGWAITTPLCLIHGGGRDGGLVPFPLPGPSLSRSLYVLCREGEMAALSERVRRQGREILARLVAGPLRNLAPWAEDDIKLA